MLDYLFVTHRELVKREGQWESFSDEFYEELLEFIVRLPLAPVNALTTSEHPGLIELVALTELHIRLRKRRNGVRERTLLEVVALQKMQDELEELQKDPEERFRRYRIRKAVKVLGVMIQHRLTILFVEMDEAELGRIQALGWESELDFEEWKRTLVGATSAARVVKTFWNSGWRVHVLLATVEEDAHLGIDLLVTLVRAPEIALAVGVKTKGRRTCIWTYLVNQEPNDSSKQPDEMERRRIWDGAQELSERTRRLWTPTQTEVGRPARNLTLEITKHDLRGVRRLLQRVYEGRNNEKAEAQSATA